MSHYQDKPEDLVQDTKQFLNSEYGKYLIPILEETAEGHLSNADNIDCPYPERYLAKHSAIKEVLNTIYSPLDDDTPARG